MIHIRSAVPADLDDVVGLIRANPELSQWSREALALGGGDLWPGIRRWRFVAEEEGRLCGFAQVSAIADEFELETMVVAEGQRRRGIGQLLVDAAQGLVRQHMGEVFRLEVRAGNLPAIALYARAGFAEAGRRRMYYRDPVEDALLMEQRFVATPPAQGAAHPVS